MYESIVVLPKWTRELVSIIQLAKLSIKTLNVMHLEDLGVLTQACHFFLKVLKSIETTLNGVTMWILSLTNFRLVDYILMNFNTHCISVYRLSAVSWPTTWTCVVFLRVLNSAALRNP